ncbi:MAG: S8 family peptidase [Candidatus Eremiobacterota bacterium]
MTRQLEHILLPDLARRFTYKPHTRPIDEIYPKRDVGQHAQLLQFCSKQARITAKQVLANRIHSGSLDFNVYLSFLLEDAPPKVLKSLETGQAELALVRDRTAQVQEAVIIAPIKYLEQLDKKVAQFRSGPLTKAGKRPNEPLISSIARFDYPDLAALWNEPEPFPESGEFDWEVWLSTEGEAAFRELAEELQIEVSTNSLKFPDRQVVSAHATPAQIAAVYALQSTMAELRRAKAVTDIISFSPSDQGDWVEDLTSRMVAPQPDCPSVCHLDTGLDHGHRLLAPACTAADCLVYNQAWDARDRRGHGTEVAGLSLFGEVLEAHLEGSEPFQVPCVLESVKILPDHGYNTRALYGAVTQGAVALVEIEQPQRSRVISMAVTAEGSTDGRPSSWSAAVDQLASGSEEEDKPKRLLVVSAGNLRPDNDYEYHTTNQVSPVQDPAQSWNALTVGATTLRTRFDEEQYPGWAVLAPSGDLCPSSTTSVGWARGWPIKPEICMEGGNFITHPPGLPISPLGLRLLTTRSRHARDPGPELTLSGDTSAACALASGLAARVMSRYPHLWPESVRGLLVHSADWTGAMLQRFPDDQGRAVIGNRLRCYGFGIPNQERALASGRHDVTMLSQTTLRPFHLVDARIQLHQMHLYPLPWPEEELMALQACPVELRVTLSYFVEPHPGERGWAGRYRYASHGLRFDIKTPEKTLEQFIQRINSANLEEVSQEVERSRSDIGRWTLGSLRDRGSIHSDRWSGTAAELASRGFLAVFPVKGWWAELKSQARYNHDARYSLMLTLSTAEEEVFVEGSRVEVDLYSPIQVQVQQLIEIGSS